MSNPVPRVGDYFYAHGRSNSGAKKGEYYPIIDKNEEMIDEDDYDYPPYRGRLLPFYKTGESLNGDDKIVDAVWSLAKYHNWFDLIRQEDMVDTDKMFNSLYEQEDNLEWFSDIHTALPEEFVITFCDEKIPT